LIVCSGSTFMSIASACFFLVFTLSYDSLL
jgi:hypothetical protein